MNDSQGSEFGENPWFSLTDSPTELALARLRLSELERHCFDEFLASTSIPWFADDQTLAIIRKHHSYAIGKLTGLLSCNQGATNAVSVALILCGLGEQSGLDFVTMVLRMTATEHRDRILVYLNGYVSIAGGKKSDSIREFLVADPEFLQAVSDLLNDEDTETVLYAIQLCHQLRLEKVLGQFREMLKSDKSTERQRVSLLMCLADTELTNDVFEATTLLQQSQQHSDGALLSSLADGVLLKFALSANDPMKSRACTCLKELVTYWLDRGEAGLHGTRITELLENVSDFTGMDDVQWLRRVATEASEVYAKAALMALLRIDPDEGRVLLLALFNDKQRINAAIRAARDTFDGTGDKELLSILRSMAERATPAFLWWIVQAIEFIGGQMALDSNRDLLERLPSSESECFMRVPQLCAPKTLIPALDELRVVPSAAIGALREWWETEEKTNSSCLMDFIVYFETAGCCASFDLATIQSNSAMPRPAKWSHLVGSYQWILGDFAAASCGLFSPENILVDLVETDKRASHDLLEVTFIHGNRLYKGLMRGRFDFERVFQMINSVLRDQGCPYLFVRLAQLNSFIRFLFVRPDALRAVAEEFGAEIRYHTEHMKLAGD